MSFRGGLAHKMLGVRATPEHPNVCRRPSSTGRTAAEASAAPAPTVGASVLHDCFPKQDTLSGATAVSFPHPQSSVSPVTLTSPLSPCKPPSWQSFLHLVQPSLCLLGSQVDMWGGRAGVLGESWATWLICGLPDKETGCSGDSSLRLWCPSFWGSLSPPPLHSHLAIIHGISAIWLLQIAEALRKYQYFCKMMKFA